MAAQALLSKRIGETRDFTEPHMLGAPRLLFPCGPRLGSALRAEKAGRLKNYF